MSAPCVIIAKVEKPKPKTVGVRVTEHKSYRGEDYTLNFSVSLGLQRDFFIYTKLSEDVVRFEENAKHSLGIVAAERRIFV